jgi:hypothetical protein
MNGGKISFRIAEGEEKRLDVSQPQLYTAGL